MDSNFVVTDFAQFYKTTGTEGDVRYYPTGGAGQRQTARNFDAVGDPPIIGGFGLYDTSQSSAYAVGVYASRDEAVEASGGNATLGWRSEQPDQPAEQSQPDTEEQPATASNTEAAESDSTTTAQPERRSRRRDASAE